MSVVLAGHHGPINMRLFFPHPLLIWCEHVESTGEVLIDWFAYLADCPCTYSSTWISRVALSPLLQELLYKESNYGFRASSTAIENRRKSEKSHCNIIFPNFRPVAFSPAWPWRPREGLNRWSTGRGWPRKRWQLQSLCIFGTVRFGAQVQHQYRRRDGILEYEQNKTAAQQQYESLNLPRRHK